MARPAPERPAGPPELALDVYEQRVGVIYEYDRLLARLREGGGGRVQAHFDEYDVEAYVVGPEPSGLVQMQLGERASSRWRARVPPLADTQPFVVTHRGQHLFSGVVYPAMGAAAIDAPVVHVSEHDGKVVLTFGGSQGAAYMAATTAIAERVDLRVLRALFGRHGVLREEKRPPSPLGSER